MTPILAIENLHIHLPKDADRPYAVEGVSLTVQRGEILCVVGESGSGKSVLSSAAMGALAPGLRWGLGDVRFEGKSISAMREADRRKLRGNRIAMIFQEPMAALNPAMTVGQQVAEVLELHSPLGPEARRERVLKLLADTHLPDPPGMAQRFPHQLSGGQCQRVVIAMALAMDPALLIADEPTTALDVTTQAQVLRLIRELRDTHGHGILFITHDFGVVADIADRVAVMQRGKLVEIGPAAQVLNAPQHPYTQALIDAVPDLAPQTRPVLLDAPTVLQVDRLSKSYGGFAALKPTSLAVQRGQTLAIVGESGSGKSTLAKTLIRLIEPSGGSISVKGSDFAALRGGSLRKMRRSLQMIFQDPFGSLNPRRTVGTMLIRAGMLGGLTRRDATAKASELMALVGLPQTALARRPAAFSGGQRQRLGIARALAMGPEIIIADESVSALDVSVQKQVLALLHDLQTRLTLTIVFITHDLRVAAEISDWIAVMQKGVVVEYGPAARVLTSPSHAYTRALIAAAPGRDWTPPRLPVSAS
ncbi:MAG: dipeptide ABC transporter ATP-binding protein [Elstera sp.]